MKKIIAVLLSLIICSLLPLVASAEEKASTNSDVSAIKGTTVKFLVTTQINDYLTDRSNEYSIDYGVKIKLLHANENDYYIWLATQIAAGNSPDIAFFDISNIDLFQPINRITYYNSAGFKNAITEPFKFKGNIFAVSSPKFIGGRFLIYNKKFFAEKNITTPDEYYKSGRWNVGTFVRVLRDLHNNIGNFTTFSSDDSLIDMLGNNVKNTLSFGNDNFKYNGFDSKYVQMHTQQMQLGSIGKYDITEFENGNIAMVAMPLSLGNNDIYKEFENISIDIAPLPENENMTAFSDMGVWQSFGIPKGAKNTPGAVSFLEYLLDETNGKYLKYIKNKTILKFMGELNKYSYNYNYAKSIFTDEYSDIMSISNAEQVNTILESKRNSINDKVNRINSMLDEISYIEKYTVSIENSDTSNGTVTESFIAEEGVIVTVSANPKIGCAFGGWFESGKLVSKEKNYSFAVTTDRNLKAIFYYRGDINSDGELNILDLICLKKFFADPLNNVVPSVYLDISDDGKINSEDLAALRKNLLLK